MNDESVYDLTPEEMAAYVAKTESAMQAKVDADIAAELAFRRSFATTRGSDREIRAESFSQQVARQVAQGDAGGSGRTEYAPPVKDIPSEHEIKKGDTMWALAKRYGLTVDELKALNADIDPQRMQLGAKLRLQKGFDPEGSGYDYDTALRAGMKADGTGENLGHWGSVAPASAEARKKYGLPEDSYMLLKGRGHETWAKAVAAEEARGSEVRKFGDRYYSIPKGQSDAVPSGADSDLSRKIRQEIEARQGRGTLETFNQLMKGFDNNPRNRETLEAGASYVGAVAAGGAAANAKKLSGVLGDILKNRGAKPAPITRTETAPMRDPMDMPRPPMTSAPVRDRFDIPRPPMTGAPVRDRFDMLMPRRK